MDLLFVSQRITDTLHRGQRQQESNTRSNDPPSIQKFRETSGMCLNCGSRIRFTRLNRRMTRRQSLSFVVLYQSLQNQGRQRVLAICASQVNKDWTRQSVIRDRVQRPSSPRVPSAQTVVGRFSPGLLRRQNLAPPEKPILRLGIELGNFSLTTLTPVG
jgi:hypothetical protein